MQKRNHWSWILFCLAILASLFTRFLLLENKPVHFDESINGWFVMTMQQIGYYKYDPANYHGPLFFYLFQLWTFVAGSSVLTIRLLTTSFSALSIFFFLRRSPWTALFFLVSPNLIFFGRSGIHESLFVLGQIFFFYGMYEYSLKQRLSSLWWALIGFLVMATTKETFVLTGFATVVALLFYFPWKSFVVDMFKRMYVPIAFVIFAILMLFTGFGKNWGGALDFFKAFSFWTATGAESGHNKSFWYWTELAWKAEPLLLLAGALAVAGLFIRRYRVLSIFSLAGWLLYSIVPYKTPWCMMSWAWPFYYLMGEMFRDWFSSEAQRKWRWVAIVLLVPLVGLNLRSAWLSVYKQPVDMSHPFVYVNSNYAFKALDDKIQEVLRTQDKLRDEPIQISIGESWPMPWTLKQSRSLHYDRVGSRIFKNALVYFCELEDVPKLEKFLAEASPGYVSKIFTFRQHGHDVKVYLRSDVFMEFPHE